ncbi:DUF4279 domain-containing protein [Paraburkholderia fungorum]|uniref:DUF4279 domain-containing protein n=1 Tax=Paraburkholderia fungorum TaxID=134537 RepID=UPI00217CF368|nr:DUF4279 domain-containing protein [Paraburkholderia fungorum]
MTLCIYAPDVEVLDAVVHKIRISPTWTSNKNGVFGWFLNTRGIDSVDLGDHLDFLLSALRGQNVDMNEIKEMGCSYRVSCFWSSVSGNGGPELKPQQMSQLAAMDMELHFDLWFDPPKEE